MRKELVLVNRSKNVSLPSLLMNGSPVTKSMCSRARAPQQEKPLQQEASVLQ